MEDQDKNLYIKLISVFAALVIFTVITLFVVRLVSSLTNHSSIAIETDEFAQMTLARINERIAPVGRVVAGKISTDKPLRSGKDIVDAACISCHGTGVLDAPVIGKVDDWKTRITQGMESILKSVIQGKGSMPPRGGDTTLNDADLKNAINYMLTESGQMLDDNADSTTISTAVTPDAVSKIQDTAAVSQGKGAEIYKSYCNSCHGTGLMDAPRLGDRTAWAPRIAQGLDVVIQNATNGKGSMPPRGGASNLVDAEINAVVIYMLNESGQKITGSVAGQTEKNEPASTPAKVEPVAVKQISARGEEIYNTACVSCHGTGLMDAPKLGDKQVWGLRYEQGLDTVMKNAANGKGSMPPRGGKADLNDNDLKSVVIYMLESSGQTVSSAEKQPLKEVAQTKTSAVVEAPAEEEGVVVVASVDTNEADQAVAAVIETALVPEPVADLPVVIDHSKGEAIYKKSCASCHDKGLDNAPRMDDVTAWVSLMASGNESLYSSVMNGKGAMPEKGGNKKLTETDIREAVDFIISKVISAL